MSELDLTSAPQNVGTTEQSAGANQAITQSAPTNISFPENWKDALDEDIRKDPSLEAIKDIKALAKSYVHTKKSFGADKIAVPGKNSSDDDWTAVYTKLGLPEKDKYDVKFPETFAKEFQSSFKETLHGAGVLPKQAQKLVDFYNDYTTKATQAANDTQIASKVQAVESLKAEWGDAFNKNLEVAKHTFQKFADKETMDYLNQSGFTSDPRVFKLFTKIGEMLGEDKAVDPRGSGGFSPADINSKISDIMAQPGYFNKAHPKHEALVQEAQGLFKMLERF